MIIVVIMMDKIKEKDSEDSLLFLEITFAFHVLSFRRSLPCYPCSIVESTA